jgi:hypothetical protein
MCGEDAIQAHEATRLANNQRAVAAIITAVSAREPVDSGAETDARVNKEFAAMMEDIEGDTVTQRSPAWTQTTDSLVVIAAL